MTSHAGIYRFDGVKADDASLIVAALGGRESAAMCRWHTDRSLTLAWRDDQPAGASGAFARHVGGQAVVWDGRLDNESTLTCVLRPLLADRPAATDADVVLAAYQKWGHESFDRLIGDFSLALWDAREGALMLARDFAGIRPLYYRVTRTAIVWSSELECLCRLGAEGAPLSVDDAWLRGFLTNTRTIDHSPFAEVRSVPPGSRLTIRHGGHVTREVFWQPDGREVVRYSREADYHEHLRQVFRDAVSCRLRSRRGVWAELSGGLDSSSIVCMADDVLRTSPNGRPLTTITYLAPEGMPGDERHYVERVEHHLGHRGRRLDERDYSPFFPAAIETRFLPRPVVGAGRPITVAGLMAQSGADTLLSGTAGDHIMWSSTVRSPQLADLLLTGRWLRLHRTLKETGTALLGRTYWNLLWNDAIQPLWSARRRQRWQWPDWILRHGREYEERPSRDASSRGLLPSVSMNLETIAHAIMTCSFHPLRACGPVDITFPYMDRRLVQFMLAIPMEQKLRAGRNRWLHRAALDGLLPSEVSTRVSKASGSGYLCRAVNRDWSRLQAIFGADALVAERGYVSLPGLQDALTRARRGVDVTGQLFLLRVIALETWLRNYRANGPRVPSARTIPHPAASTALAPIRAGRFA